MTFRSIFNDHNMLTLTARKAHLGKYGVCILK